MRWLERERSGVWGKEPTGMGGFPAGGGDVQAETGR